MHPYPTTQFLATFEGPEEVLALWVDWMPAVDGNPHLPWRAHLEDDALVVSPDGEIAGRGARRVAGLRAEVRQALGQGPWQWRICGPSGVLARHTLILEAPGKQ